MSLNPDYHHQRSVDLGMPLGTGKRYGPADLRRFIKGVANGATAEQRPRAVEMTLYTSNALPDCATAQEIADLFFRNYPPAHDVETRRHDVERYRTGDQIIDQLADGNFWLVARIDGAVAGALKFREENRSTNPNLQEFLLSWIIVENDYRQQDVAANLINHAADLLRPLQQGRSIDLIADVHRDNDPSKNLFSRLGFVQTPGKADHLLAMRKHL